jgi:transcriptional regulator with XRE-family HTH domain
MHLKYNISNVNARIGRFVRSNRQKMNMSAEELAVELNICQQHVSRFERAVRFYVRVYSANSERF